MGTQTSILTREKNPWIMTLLVLALLVITLVLYGCRGTGVNLGGSSDDDQTTTDDSNNVTDNSIDNTDNSVVNIGEDPFGEMFGDRDDEFGVNPECSGQVQTNDGPGGFLWKPEGNHGFPVILFPPAYDVRFEDVLVYLDNGDIEKAVFTGFANGARQHWRVYRNASDYTGTIVVKDAAQECVWEVTDTTDRQD